MRLEKFLLSGNYSHMFFTKTYSDGFQKILKKYPSVEDKRKAQEANRLWFKLRTARVILALVSMFFFQKALKETLKK